MAVGLLGFLGIGVESSGGVASQSVSVVEFIPFTSETLQVTRQDLPDPSIWNHWDERRMYNGMQKVEGNVSMVLHPLLAGYFLRLGFDACTAQAGWEHSSNAATRAHRFTTLNTQFQAGSGSDLPTATIEVNRGPSISAGSSWVYMNCTANALEVSIEAGGMTRLSAELMGKNAAIKGRSTPSYVPQDTFLWNTASVSLNGGGTSLFQSLTWRLENNLEGISKLDGRLTPDLLKRSDFRRVTINGSTIFQDFAEYDRFIAGSEVALDVWFTGKQIATAPAVNEEMSVHVPRFRYSTYPIQVGGPGPIQVGWTGRGMIDPTSGHSLEVTVVNTRISPYTVNTTA